jgi:type II secretory pathway component PulM
VSEPNATSDDSVQHHERARRKRRKVGAELFKGYLRQRDARERRIFVLSSVLLLIVLAACFGFFARGVDP